MQTAFPSRTHLPSSVAPRPVTWERGPLPLRLRVTLTCGPGSWRSPSAACRLPDFRNPGPCQPLQEGHEVGARGGAHPARGTRAGAARRACAWGPPTAAETSDPFQGGVHRRPHPTRSESCGGVDPQPPACAAWGLACSGHAGPRGLGRWTLHRPTAPWGWWALRSVCVTCSAPPGSANEGAARGGTAASGRWAPAGPARPSVGSRHCGRPSRGRTETARPAPPLR